MSSIGPIGAGGPDPRLVNGVSHPEKHDFKGPQGSFDASLQGARGPRDADVGDPTVRTIDALKASGAPADAVFRETVGRELAKLTGDTVPDAVIDKIVEQFRNDPELGRITDTLFGRSER
jgi:hypothetical protein